MDQGKGKVDTSVILGAAVLAMVVGMGSFLTAAVLAATKVREHIVVRSPRGLRALRAPLVSRWAQSLSELCPEPSRLHERSLLEFGVAQLV